MAIEYKGEPEQIKKACQDILSDVENYVKDLKTKPEIFKDVMYTTGVTNDKKMADSAVNIAEGYIKLCENLTSAIEVCIDECDMMIDYAG